MYFICHILCLGDASLYAHYVFNAMFSEALKKNNGQITFSDYACALSLLCRGTVADKIQWIFTLYDTKKDGSYPIIFNHLFSRISYKRQKKTKTSFLLSTIKMSSKEKNKSN